MSRRPDARPPSPEQVERSGGRLEPFYGAPRHMTCADIPPAAILVRSRMSQSKLSRHLPLSPPMFHVLLSLAKGDRHGYLIMKEVAERTAGEVRLSTGTLYGIIKRLLAAGMIDEIAASDPRRRAYRLTAAEGLLCSAAQSGAR